MPITERKTNGHKERCVQPINGPSTQEARSVGGTKTAAPTGDGEVQIESRCSVCLIDWKTTFKSTSDKFGWVVDK